MHIQHACGAACASGPYVLGVVCERSCKPNAVLKSCSQVPVAALGAGRHSSDVHVVEFGDGAEDAEA